MNTEPSSTQPTAAQASELVSSALSTADAGASQSILNLKMVHQARLSQLKRTAATLKQQYGAQDPSVKAAEAAVTATSARVSHLAAIHQQVATPAPQVAATGWALQGRVFNSTLQPVPHLTVFLVDGQKTFARQYGFAYTDSTGYFLINYPGDSTSGQSGSQQPAPPTLYIEIANASGKPIYLSTTAFTPTPGSTTYQNLTLPAGEQPLGTPPPNVRNSAIPNGKK